MQDLSSLFYGTGVMYLASVSAEKKEKKLSVRLSLSYKQRLKTLADDDGRTMSNLALLILEEGIVAREQAMKDSSPPYKAKGKK